MHSTTLCHPVMVAVLLLLLLTACPSNDFFIITTLCTQTSHVSCWHQMLNDKIFTWHICRKSAESLRKVLCKTNKFQFAVLLSLDLILYLIRWVSDMLHGLTSIIFVHNEEGSTRWRERGRKWKEGSGQCRSGDIQTGGYWWILMCFKPTTQPQSACLETVRVLLPPNRSI